MINKCKEGMRYDRKEGRKVWKESEEERRVMKERKREK